MKNKPTEKIHSTKPLFENDFFWFTNLIPFLICVQFCLASRGWFDSIHPIWPASRGGKTMNRGYNELGLIYCFLLGVYQYISRDLLFRSFWKMSCYFYLCLSDSYNLVILAPGYRRLCTRGDAWRGKLDCHALRDI